MEKINQNNASDDWNKRHAEGWGINESGEEEHQNPRF